MHWALIVILAAGANNVSAAFSAYFDTADLCHAAESKVVGDLSKQGIFGGAVILSHQCALVSVQP